MLYVKNVYKGSNVKNLYKGLNARSEVYLSKEYFCKMYPTCVSSKLCEFIYSPTKGQVQNVESLLLPNQHILSYHSYQFTISPSVSPVCGIYDIAR